MCVSIVLLLVLQSLGQLSLRDIVIVAALAALSYLYMAHATSGVRLD